MLYFSRYCIERRKYASELLTLLTLAAWPAFKANAVVSQWLNYAKRNV